MIAVNNWINGNEVNDDHITSAAAAFSGVSSRPHKKTNVIVTKSTHNYHHHHRRGGPNPHLMVQHQNVLINHITSAAAAFSGVSSKRTHNYHHHHRRRGVPNPHLTPPDSPTSRRSK
ncbi:hypothetical protein O3M35_003853 [Rhynocoris fuscipes]|uniref:Uncharacterized protein n=1 Tax=Rhynocoris fuscipes TaxID=488301 RepID=A0AAW1CMA5_9HEMI